MTGRSTERRGLVRNLLHGRRGRARRAHSESEWPANAPRRFAGVNRPRRPRRALTPNRSASGTGPAKIQACRRAAAARARRALRIGLAGLCAGAQGGREGNRRRDARQHFHSEPEWRGNGRRRFPGVPRTLRPRKVGRGKAEAGSPGTSQLRTSRFRLFEGVPFSPPRARRSGGFVGRTERPARGLHGPANGHLGSAFQWGSFRWGLFGDGVWEMASRWAPLSPALSPRRTKGEGVGKIRRQEGRKTAVVSGQFSVSQ